MVAAIANSLSDDDADKRLSVIEAGTGTGKTVGYLIAALPIARALKKTVVVSTGTIALQEQLIHKDIPELLETGIIVALWLKDVAAMRVIFAWSSV